jgi:hypothetical protein
MQKTIGALIAGGLLIAAAPAFADDSSASLGAGGIVFTKNTPVRMAAEELTISPKSVRIRFEFVNDTAKDVDTIVAFPLPDIELYQFAGSALGTVTDDPVNFVGFKAVVDGKPVAFKVEQRAFAKDKDVTALIASTGLQVNLVAGDGWQKLDKLSPEKHKRLIDGGILETDGAGNYYPKWLVRTKFFWPQRFAAHKKVVIEHSYQPVTGQSFAVSSEFDGSMENPFAKQFCLDAATLARVKAMMKAHKGTPDGMSPGMLIAYETDYILKTANNWNGPIGRFHLTLDKLKADNTLSLCWDGELKKTGPTTFEAVRENFAPARDIHLLVLE